MVQAPRQYRVLGIVKTYVAFIGIESTTWGPLWEMPHAAEKLKPSKANKMGKSDVCFQLGLPRTSLVRCGTNAERGNRLSLLRMWNWLSTPSRALRDPRKLRRSCSAQRAANDWKPVKLLTRPKHHIPITHMRKTDRAKL